MKLSYLTGRSSALRTAVLDRLREVLAPASAKSAVLLVPDHYTLQAEIDVLSEISGEGFFRLQVLSPGRLYQRVFQRAGAPGQTRIDEQGRVMLMHAAARDAGKALNWYADARNRAGFAEKCVRQINAFKQAGLTPEDLRKLADIPGSLPHKLKDLALLYEAYEAALQGRFMDGEDEANRACERMDQADFLRGATVLVYGFDLITPTLRRVILSILPVCHELLVALNLREAERDGRLYTPVLRSVQTLNKEAWALGCSPARIHLPDEPRSGAMGWLEKELFCIPQEPFPREPGDVQISLCKDPQEEAEYCAAMIRRLCRTRGWRYRDYAVACMSSDESFMGSLRRAFRLYGIPLFLTQGRPADKHSLAVYLLSALSAVTKGWRLNDLVLLIRSGYGGLTDEEADILVNYVQAHGLKGGAWRRPLTRGSEEERLAAEPLRERIAAPLVALEQRSIAAQSTAERLAALFALLEDVQAYDRIQSDREQLEALDLSVWAAEGIQVWNRIIEALDQMAQLLADRPMSLEEIYEMLRRALSAAIVKALPQSADAVEGGLLEHLRGKPIKALFVVGASDSGTGAGQDLLSDEEIASLRDLGIDLGMDSQERMRMQRLGLKSLLSMTGECLLLSRAQSDKEGRAQQNSMLMNEVIRLLPKAQILGGVTGSGELLRPRLEHRDAALCLVPSLRDHGDPAPGAARRALERMEGTGPALERMDASFAHRVFSENLEQPLDALLRPLGGVSATRLERFAACPFKHFVYHALRPEEFIPFSLSPRDAGNFYHEALERFVTAHGRQLGSLTEEEGCALMDRITAGLIDEAIGHYVGQSALAKAEGEQLQRVARRAASVMVRQFLGSLFVPASAELFIDRNMTRFSDGTRLEGRIDRIDLFEDPGGASYVRVIDYKTGGRKVSLEQIYHGLQLQLPLYLHAATTQLAARPAGAFYFTVSDPLLETECRDPEQVERERDRSMRLEGLILKDERIISAMARHPDRAVNVSYTKAESPRANDSQLSLEDFKLLMSHTLCKAEDMLQKMREGDSSIAPARCGALDACAYCPYHTVCGWDLRLPGAEPRELEGIRSREVTAILRSKGDPEGV
ncbi:MAG: hypothetical protein GX246_01350 [Clostridiales bacterium]|nr:PD-(D/E)XK nuclease family protein [Bacillota bacterium]NLL53776.1 hypothetical protein [Clostridiales bacterium]